MKVAKLIGKYGSSKLYVDEHMNEYVTCMGDVYKLTRSASREQDVRTPVHDVKIVDYTF